MRSGHVSKPDFLAGNLKLAEVDFGCTLTHAPALQGSTGFVDRKTDTRRYRKRRALHLSFQFCAIQYIHGLHWAIPENILHPPPPPWTTPNWVPKNFRISKKDNCSFCRIPEPADSKS